MAIASCGTPPGPRSRPTSRIVRLGPSRLVERVPPSGAPDRSTRRRGGLPRTRSRGTYRPAGVPRYPAALWRGHPFGTGLRGSCPSRPWSSVSEGQVVRHVHGRHAALGRVDGGHGRACRRTGPRTPNPVNTDDHALPPVQSRRAFASPRRTVGAGDLRVARTSALIEPTATTTPAVDASSLRPSGCVRPFVSPAVAVVLIAPFELSIVAPLLHGLLYRYGGDPPADAATIEPRRPYSHELGRTGCFSPR